MILVPIKSYLCMITCLMGISEPIYQVLNSLTISILVDNKTTAHLVQILNLIFKPANPLHYRSVF